ncbi:MAG: hypothetical protein NTX29_05460 [Actinobacteria bacterium]|nr:hypothetical protein [Actinomycetota bacterium]
MIRAVGYRDEITLASLVSGKAALSRSGAALWSAIGVESLGQTRYRRDCKDDEPVEPWYRRRWFMINRATKYNRASSFSSGSVWLLLVLLLITGVTGFVIDVLYLPPTPALGYWFFLFHVAVAMELLLLMPFTKFAHTIYRPVALFFYSLAGKKVLQDT